MSKIVIEIEIAYSNPIGEVDEYEAELEIGLRFVEADEILEVGYHVGVLEMHRGTASTLNSTQGLISGWFSDPAQLQEIPEVLRPGVESFMQSQAEALWAEVAEGTEEDDKVAE